MELYGRVRRAVLVDGLSQRAVAREFGISRKSVRKMVAFALPPGYQRTRAVMRPKLDGFVGVIDAMVEEDKLRPARQRHTAKRVWERLKEEHQFTGGYTIVKNYLRSAADRGREMFVPLTHPAGEAQADFGEALVVIAGVEQKAHYLAMDLPHSDDCFVVAFPAETTEAFLEGHVRAFEYFGGVPTRILYDNTRIAVAKILGGTDRQRTRAFCHCLHRCMRPVTRSRRGSVRWLWCAIARTTTRCPRDMGICRCWSAATFTRSPSRAAAR